MQPQAVLLLLVAGTLGLAAIATLLATSLTLEQRPTAIVQRLGALVREAGPGLHVKIPLIDKVVGPRTAILIPHSPGKLASLSEQMRTAMIEADQTVHPADAARNVSGAGGPDPGGADRRLGRTRDAS